jgi:hypothetical protein
MIASTPLALLFSSDAPACGKCACGSTLTCGWRTLCDAGHISLNYAGARKFGTGSLDLERTSGSRMLPSVIGGPGECLGSFDQFVGAQLKGNRDGEP